MEQDRFSFRNLAINYLCLYAVLYPLLAHFLMETGGTGGVGSTPVHFFQLSAFLAFFGIAKFNKETLRSGIDVWIVASLYFAAEALYLAVFFAEDAKIAEVAYAARFVMWFLFATIVARKSLEIEQLEKLSFSFLIGTFIQGLLAIWAFNTQSVGSIYKEVYATTGGVNVSGKTIVSFVILGIFLAFYWTLVRRRGRWIYAIPLLVGILVILFSYNRATQLSFAIVILFDSLWLFRGRKIRAFFLLGFAVIIVGAFLTSPWGESFLVRWQRIRIDGGNGRVTLVRSALEAFADPESMSSLLFGRGNRQTRLLMFRACGAYVGTHSDLFDFLTMYGLVGGAFYVWIVFKILTLGGELPHRSLEYLCVRSTGAFLILTGLMTGSFQSTYAFIMFFTICQYWLERGALAYGSSGGMHSDRIVQFPMPSAFDDDPFCVFSPPVAEDEFLDDESFFDGEEREKEVFEEDDQADELSISDFADGDIANFKGVDDECEESLSSGTDFKTVYSVNNSEFGCGIPFIVVNNRSPNTPSGFPNNRYPSLEPICGSNELKESRDVVDLDDE